MEKYTLYINGMHCQACVVLTEEKIGEVPGAKKVTVSLAKGIVEVEGEFPGYSLAQIAEKMSEVLKPHGYSVTTAPEKKPVKWSEFSYAVPIALAFVIAFFALQKLGIVNLITSSEVTYGTAFFIGIVASLSTCMAVVGGLALSLSAKFAKESASARPQMYFHLSRLVSFFVLGAVIGAAGAVIKFGIIGTAIMTGAVGLIMLILGINLLEVFPWAQKFQLTMPKSLSKYVGGLEKAHHIITPTLAGIATFFLPCGFTQSMQLYTLTTGSAWVGALTMFAFALGTLPVLGLLSFGAVKLRDKLVSGIFFKAAGLVVIAFGILNIVNGLASAGIISPLGI